jgi:DNA-binding transcriptional regulator GbsR (MarR family)
MKDRNMAEDVVRLKQDFISGLSNISGFWGFPKGMGAIFAVLYLSPGPLSLDELVKQTGLTKGAISTNEPLRKPAADRDRTENW